MPTTQREERTLLGHDGFALVAPSHHPAIASLPAEELRALATRLRTEHAKLRDLIREGKRARRGKGEARAAAGAEAGKATRRKQVYAAALKRVNKRFEELTHERRRAEHRAALKAALARRQAQRAQHPSSGFGARDGMRSKASGKGARGVHGARIGSVSAQNRRAQAARDG
ncbi:hypothetical protein [Falsiroseomonas sp. HW251]|uniref:hypothetical protein n=1 Tax=Falsiroseomonas sp. HW251 TaxID=3390998 RepID=UPI003D3111BE